MAKLLHGFMAKWHVAHIHCFKGIAFFEWPGNSVVNTLNPDKIRAIAVSGIKLKSVNKVVSM